MNAEQLEQHRLRQRLETLVNTRSSRTSQVARLRDDRAALVDIQDRLTTIQIPVISSEPLCSQLIDLSDRWVRDVQARIDVIDRNIDATTATVGIDDPEIADLQEVLR